MLKAPVKTPNGKLEYPKKGTPQGGIISQLLANIVLNELDHLVESNWEENPVVYKYVLGIVRYADDFRIFCRTKPAAEKIKLAIMQWLKERLKLEVSPEKTRVGQCQAQILRVLGIQNQSAF